MDKAEFKKNYIIIPRPIDDGRKIVRIDCVFDKETDENGIGATLYPFEDKTEEIFEEFINKN